MSCSLQPPPPPLVLLDAAPVLTSLMPALSFPALTAWMWITPKTKESPPYAPSVAQVNTRGTPPRCPTLMLPDCPLQLSGCFQLQYAAPLLKCAWYMHG